MEWPPRDGQNGRQADGDGRTGGSCAAAAAHCGPVAVGAAAGAARESDDACAACSAAGDEEDAARAHPRVVVINAFASCLDDMCRIDAKSPFPERISRVGSCIRLGLSS